MVLKTFILTIITKHHNITTAILYPDWSRTGWPPLKTESSYARNTGHGGSPYMVSTHSSEENEWKMYQLYFYLNEIQSLNISLKKTKHFQKWS